MPKQAIYEFFAPQGNYRNKFLYGPSKKQGTGWTHIDTAFYAPQQGNNTVPVHRFHHEDPSGWFFCFNINVKPPGVGWIYDGPVFNAYKQRVNDSVVPIFEHEAGKLDFQYSYMKNIPGKTNKGVAFWAYPPSG